MLVFYLETAPSKSIDFNKNIEFWKQLIKDLEMNLSYSSSNNNMLSVSRIFAFLEWFINELSLSNNAYKPITR